MIFCENDATRYQFHGVSVYMYEGNILLHPGRISTAQLRKVWRGFEKCVRQQLKEASQSERMLLLTHTLLLDSVYLKELPFIVSTNVFTEIFWRIHFFSDV